MSRPDVPAIAVGIGCDLLIMPIRPEGEREMLPEGLRGARGPQVIRIAREVGMFCLTTRTPLGAALLDANIGDLVRVPFQLGTRSVKYQVMAIDPNHALAG